MSVKTVLGPFFALLMATSAACADEPAIGPEAAAQLPIFDAHIHYKEPAWAVFPPNRVLQLMDDSGVAMGLVSSTPDDGTIQLLEFAPSRIVPELRPYHGAAGSSNWTHAAGMTEYLEHRLHDHPHEGIGEFHIRNLADSDQDVLRSVVAMAQSRNLPLHVHSSFEPIEFLYEIDPTITVIWAHAGMSDPVEEVERMLDTYPSLYADTSFREGQILPGFDRQISPKWKALLIKHEDRFMIGSDTWVNGQWAVYDQIIGINRLWLSFLPKQTAEKIAYKNAEKFFGRTISTDLIGQR